MTRRSIVTALLLVSAGPVVCAQGTPGPACLVRSLDNPAQLHGFGASVLDTPILQAQS